MGKFHTMVIANATNQVRVLHRIGADGAAIPEGALQPGEAIFLHRASNQGFWKVGNALAVQTAAFRSPGPRGFAMITG